MSRLLDTIARQEGFRPDVYADQFGVWSIGFGHAITDERGVLMTRDNCTLEQARALCGAQWTFARSANELGAHVDRTTAELTRRVEWFANLPELVRWGCIDQAYQLGVNGSLAFVKQWAALKGGKWSDAEAHALDSTWARQTPERAKEVAAWIGNHEV